MDGFRGLEKHSVRLRGHATSVSLEPAFWESLKRIAGAEGVSLNHLIARIDEQRSGNLSSALRLFVLDRLEAAAREAEALRDGAAGR